MSGPDAAGIVPGMENEVSFREALERALKSTSRSLRSVATESGVSYEQLKSLQQGKAKTTNFEDGLRVIRALGVTVDDFMDGETSPKIAVPAVALQESIMVPVYDVVASAGNGSVVEYEPIIDQLSFPREFLRKLTRSSPQNLAIISVKGDSMEPTLKDDDIVLLDGSKTNTSFDGLFVVRFGDALHVKRLTRGTTPDRVTVLSDNRAVYPPVDMAAADVEVIGKVLWYGRKV